MKIIKLYCLLLFVSSGFLAIGQDYLNRFKQLDVIKYDLNINLFEKQNKIVVNENVTIQFLLVLVAHNNQQLLRMHSDSLSRLF